MRAMLASSSARLAAMHAHHVHREPWPAFAAIDVRAIDAATCAHAARQWAGRARNEYGSVHQFAALAHALAEARAPVTILGALTRLLSDETRHVELCAELAGAYAHGANEATPTWPVPRAPWPDAPRVRSDDDVPRVHAWAAEVVLSACCVGETLSVPMLEAIAVVATEPTAQEVARQILRDEHLHATFGWELLAWLLPQLDAAGHAHLDAVFPRVLAGFEESTCGAFRAADLAGTTIEIAERDSRVTNLGTLDARTYAAIFYATLEAEIFPRFAELGLDPLRAWTARPQSTASGRSET